MATIIIEKTRLCKKITLRSKKVNFFSLYKKMEMKDFYDLLSKEL